MLDLGPGGLEVEVRGALVCVAGAAGLLLDLCRSPLRATWTCSGRGRGRSRTGHWRVRGVSLKLLYPLRASDAGRVAADALGVVILMGLLRAWRSRGRAGSFDQFS